jgi:hypothetical protein
MDFDSAIRAHVQWKTKLANYIEKPDHTLSATTVSGDQNCELGKWLHAEGKKFANAPGFATLVADHARFHKAAGEVVRKADSGKNVSQEIALGGDSEFAKVSSAVVSELMQLKRKVA